jgi:multicomponent K+:H+ antiporter subunit G
MYKSTLRFLTCFDSLALTLRASRWLLLPLVVAPCMALAREIVESFYGDCCMQTWIEGLVALFLLIGSLFALVGAIGLYRLPDFFMRLHGPTKATTMGVGGMVIASLIYFGTRGNGISLHELLITLFLFITAPVSAHMLAKAALQQKLPMNENTRGRPWEQ